MSLQCRRIAPDTTWIDDEPHAREVAARAIEAGVVAVDTETTGLSSWKDRVIIWSLCYEEGSRYAIPPELLSSFWDMFHCEGVVKLYTNAKFDMHMLANSGVPAFGGPVWCTAVMDWLLNENRRGRHGLKESAWDHLSIKMASFADVFGKPKKGEDVGARLLRVLEERFDEAVDYASKDAWCTFLLASEVYEPLLSQAISETRSRQLGDGTMVSSYGPSLWDHYREYEVPFTRVLWNCERRGFPLDLGFLRELEPRFEMELLEVERAFNNMAGREVNLDSPLQMRQLFFDDWDFPIIKYTKGGESGKKEPSVDSETLEAWVEEGSEEAAMVIRYRQYKTLQSRYVKGMQKACSPKLQIHTKLNQHITVTGRLSSSDPACQNIPIRTKLGKLIRQAFVAPWGHDLIVGDYSQAEMRVLAHLCEDPDFIDTILKGDVHIGNTAKIFDVDYDEVYAAKHTDDDDKTERDQYLCTLRDRMKAIGFGQPN